MTFLALFGLFSFIQVVSSHHIAGYVGENITLPAGANPSWTLDKIEWAIYSNNTWIATFRDTKRNIRRFHRYIGRLYLNTSSGDLTIYNLNFKDEIEYSVDLTSDRGDNTVNKIKLSVKSRLPKPTVMQRQWLINGSCVMMLKCCSPVPDAELSWTPESSSEETKTISRPDGLFLVIFSKNPQKSSEFTCWSKRDTDNASTVWEATYCDETAVTTARMTTPAPTESPRWRERTSFCFVGGFVFGGLLALILQQCFKGKFQSFEKRQ